MKRKSKSSAFITVIGIPVILRSKEKSGLALSSCEDEYIAMSKCVKSIIWLRRILFFLSLLEPSSTQLFVDSMAAIR